MFEAFPWTAWLRGAGDPLRALGRLERDVMEVMWRGSEMPVRDVQTALTRSIAYTTVMTTLDRLFKKGLVSRRREGRAFLYSAAQTREQMAATLTGGVLRGLFADAPGEARPFLSNLVDAVSDGDAQLLDELERLVREKRDERKGQGR